MNILCMGGRTVGPEVAWTWWKRISQPNTARPNGTSAGSGKSRH